MFKAVRRIAATLALAAGLVLAGAQSASAAVTVTLTPSTATAGTTVTVIGANCSETATAIVENTDVNVSMPNEDGQAKGTFVVPADWRVGAYTISVKCGDDTAAAKLTVTDGSGASTGSGSTASDPATAIALTGAAVVAIAALGLWFLRRRDRAAA